MRRLSLLLSLALLASTTAACQMRSSSRTTAMVGGAATVALGFAVSAQGPVDSDTDGENDFMLNDNLGAYLLGGVLILAGGALFVSGAAAETSDDPVEPNGGFRTPKASDEVRAVVTSPLALPILAVEGSVLTSPATAFALDLTGWSVGRPYLSGGRTHVTAMNGSTELELVMQKLARPARADDVIAQIDLAPYGPLARRASAVGTVPAVELSGAGNESPVIVTVAVSDAHLLSAVCRGEPSVCREALARATWSAGAPGVMAMR